MRPCLCDHLPPAGQPYTTEYCRLCYLYYTDPAYKGEWGRGGEKCPFLGGQLREEERPANFVVLDAADEVEAIRLRPAARWVVRQGAVVAETEPAHTTVFDDGNAIPVSFTPGEASAPG